MDGEIQLGTAWTATGATATSRTPSCGENANVLIFPDLQSGTLALHLLQKLGDAVAVGPVLTGTRLPVQLLQYGSTVQEVVNLAAVGVVSLLECGRARGRNAPGAD